ncbi:hypothetical protein ACVWWO_005605 [Bradyrhizobium sp. F1.13.1]
MAKTLAAIDWVTTHHDQKPSAIETILGRDLTNIGGKMTTDVVVDWQNNGWMLEPGSYWHLTPERGGLIRHNARLSKGVLLSVGVTSLLPGMSGATTRHAMSAGDSAKERLWERTRLQINAALPSRMKALYCFETKELADRAARDWFGNEPRLALELRITTAALTHRGDRAAL